MPKPVTKNLKEMFFDLADKRNHKIVSIDLKNKKETQLKIHCNRCGTEFKTTGHNYTRAGGEKTDKNYLPEEKTHFFPYCCPGCKTVYKQNYVTLPTGDQHHNWKGGIPEEKREGYDKEKYNTWRRGVFKQYNGTCFLTGSQDGDNLHAHHLNSWFMAPEERYNISNGVLLHKKIHSEFHSSYGNKTTRENFIEFAKNQYKKTDFPWENSNFPDKISTLQTFLGKEKQEKQEKMEKLITERNLKLISGVYENKQSEYVVYCPKHDQYHTVKYHNFIRSTHYGISCCRQESPNKKAPPSQLGAIRSSETINKINATRQNNCQQKIEQTAKERLHSLLSGTFKNQHSQFEIRCQKHNEVEVITYHNYMRRVNGLLRCCIQSK